MSLAAGLLGCTFCSDFVGGVAVRPGMQLASFQMATAGCSVLSLLG